MCIFNVGRSNPEPFEDKIQKMFQGFKALNVRMSVKMHYLNCHLTQFQSDLRRVSDQHGERFHQTISVFEERFPKSSSVSNMLADFLWLNKF